MSRVLGLLAAFVLMGSQRAGCASFSREDFTVAEAERAALGQGSDIRFNADDPQAALAFTAKARAELEKSGAQQFDILAISGGGAIKAERYLTMAGYLGDIATLEKPFKREVLLEMVRSKLADQ